MEFYFQSSDQFENRSVIVGAIFQHDSTKRLTTKKKIKILRKMKNVNELIYTSFAHVYTSY